MLEVKTKFFDCQKYRHCEPNEVKAWQSKLKKINFKKFNLINKVKFENQSPNLP